MERTMSDKSLRYSWGFGVITLVVMNIYNQIQHNQIHWSFIILMGMMREFDTYESKKHPESPRGLIFFVKFIGYILRDLA